MSICVNASGVGVRTAAARNIINIAHFLFLRKKAGVTIPSLDKIIIAIGSSKTAPNISVKIVINERYSEIEMTGRTSGPAKLIRNFNANGITRKKANAVPHIKSAIEKGRKSRNILRSLWLKAVEVNPQI